MPLYERKLVKYSQISTRFDYKAIHAIGYIVAFTGKI